MQGLALLQSRPGTNVHKIDLSMLQVFAGFLKLPLSLNFKYRKKVLIFSISFLKLLINAIKLFSFKSS